MRILHSFWAWYERTYVLQITLALGLFLLQAVHLLWLSGDVVWARLFGEELVHVHGLPETLIVLIDYTEIPALIAVSLIYINELRRSTRLTASNFWANKDFIYLLFLNTQWIHLFWITDEFVVTTFNGAGSVLPAWLAWVAIAIDYLELPVMVDTLRRFTRTIRSTMAPKRSEAMSETASLMDGE